MNSNERSATSTNMEGACRIAESALHSEQGLSWFDSRGVASRSMMYHIMWISSYAGTPPAICACGVFGLGERQLARPSVRFYRCREFESLAWHWFAIVVAMYHLVAGPPIAMHED